MKHHLLLQLILYFSINTLFAQLEARNFSEVGNEADSVWTRVHKDSVKCFFTKKGDSIFTEVIDLMDGENDSFNGGFDIVSLLEYRVSNVIEDPLVFIKLNDLVIGFNKDELRKTVESKITSGEPIVKNMRVLDLTNIEDANPPEQIGFKDILQYLDSNLATDTLGFNMELIPFFLLKNNHFNANFKGKPIESIIIEEYETSFSSGVNYYFLNEQIDTVTTMGFTYWMR